ncbi:MAG: hypothetical protein Q8M94_01395, partial [Ignavibacteria bacterium]|nr:hypothetical protein [Ignavibacteria bacterium]
MPPTFELTLAGSLAVAAVVIIKGISTTTNFVEDQQDIYQSSIIVLAGLAIVTGVTVGTICSLCFRTDRNPFPGAEGVFNAQELPQDRRRRITARFNLPVWACDPVDLQLLTHPYLTITASGNPNTSQTYEQSTVIEITNRWQGVCPLSNERITGGLLNKPLQQAIQDLLKSKSKNGTNSFFSRSNSKAPNWAKCELTHEIMNNPCLAVIKNE